MDRTCAANNSNICNTVSVQALAQAAVTLTSTSGSVGTPLTLTGAGGSGTGAFSYAVTSAGTAVCSISGGTTLNATAPGTCTVTATKAADGSYNAEASSATTVTFVVSLPTVTGISPTSGSTAGGTSVTISGTNFNGATGVTIGGASCAPLSGVTATSITCVTSAHAAGAASVLVTTPGGTNAANALFTYTVRQTPSINTSIGGGTVTAQIVTVSTGCSIDLANTVAFTPPAYNGTTPPYGGLKLRLTGCLPGETVVVSTTWPSMAGLTFQKYGPTPTSNGSSVYYTPHAMGIAGSTVTYSITDNGLGDDTFTVADGVINDPAVPVTGGASIPTLSEWGAMLLSGLMLVFGLTRVRRQKAI